MSTYNTYYSQDKINISTIYINSDSALPPKPIVNHIMKCQKDISGTTFVAFILILMHGSLPKIPKAAIILSRLKIHHYSFRPLPNLLTPRWAAITIMVRVPKFSCPGYFWLLGFLFQLLIEPNYILRSTLAIHLKM